MGTPRPKIWLVSSPASFADVDSRDHAARVAGLAKVLAGRLGWNGRRSVAVAIGGALHDIGKSAVPLSILSKTGPLTEGELWAIRRHPAAGARLVSSIATLRFAIPSVLYHHERWDGGGYPTGRARKEIPLEARILAVADAFDAMVSDRPYRRALSVEAALAELDRCAGSQFDPVLAEAFVECWRAGELAGLAPDPPQRRPVTALPIPRASTAFA
jgi:HD-GYP domain-containing protein (c-di-GMP phosphodiesterase class II)